MAPTAASPLDGFDMIMDLGQGNFGVAKLMRNRATGEEVAVKVRRGRAAASVSERAASGRGEPSRAERARGEVAPEVPAGAR